VARGDGGRVRLGAAELTQEEAEAADRKADAHEAEPGANPG